MTNPMRIKQIRRAYLQALRLAGGFALAEDLLWNYVSDLIRPELTLGERGMTTAFLRDNKYIVAVESDIDPGLKQWAITERGRTLLDTL